MWAFWLPTPALTTSLARPSREEGQLLCWDCSSKTWSSLTGQVMILFSNLGTRLGCRAVLHQGGHQPSLSPPQEETWAQREPQWSITEPPTRCRGRDQEKKARGWTAVPCSAQHLCYWNLWGGFATDLKCSWVMFTNFSAKVGLNFSNQISRLNITWSKQGRGQLVASERNRTKLIMRQYCLI